VFLTPWGRPGGLSLRPTHPRILIVVKAVVAVIIVVVIAIVVVVVIADVVVGGIMS
jgi:hypothetical protein